MHGEGVKLMEIGLGCTQAYGTGASVNLWERLLTLGKNRNGESQNSQYSGNGVLGDSIWEAEVLTDCVYHHLENTTSLHRDMLNLMLGDQGDVDTLHTWISGSGGEFDIIIDDGSHRQHDIYTSFNILFREALKPGGYYFIEDLHVSRVSGWYADIDTERRVVMIEVIKDWIEQLVATVVPDDYIMRYKYKIPPKVKWIFCQHEACVIAKCELNDKTPNCV